MAAEEQIFREFLETYNRIVEECFNRCVYTFNYRYLLEDEIDCASRCTSRFVNFNQRLAMNFATIQAKKMIDAQEQAEAQQQDLPAATVSSSPVTDSSTPT